MSVDQELARAVEEAEAEAVPAVAQATGGTPPGGPNKPKRNLGLLVGLLVIVAGILGLVFTSFKGAAIYSVGVDQLMKEPARYSQRAVRVKGMLVKGTLARRDEPCEYRFRLTENGKELSVHHPSCVVPDTFKDMPGMDVEVQAEGKLADDGKTFVSTNIVAKCPSKYEMKQKSMAGELAPHAGQQASPLQTLSQKD
jgi:cytochrome c-type biogenesis protein CcmE